MSNCKDSRPEWHLLNATQVETPSCQRKLASRIGQAADDFKLWIPAFAGMTTYTEIFSLSKCHSLPTLFRMFE